MRVAPKGIRRTLMLARAVLQRRIRQTGLKSLFSRPAPSATKILYVDAGLHKKARELKLLSKWLANFPNLRLVGFEAHPEYYEAACQTVGDLPRIELLNQALVGPGQGATVQLNLNGGSGVGDSLIRRVGEESISVETSRLSEYLRKVGFKPQQDILLVRMNIEGAEVFVLEDMIDADLISAVDGFYGYWDDPYKIGGEFAQRFDALMNRLRIETVPFNDIDSRSILRRALIKYDIATSILSATLKKTERQLAS